MVYLPSLPSADECPKTLRPLGAVGRMRSRGGVVGAWGMLQTSLPESAAPTLGHCSLVFKGADRLDHLFSFLIAVKFT